MWLIYLTYASREKNDIHVQEKKKFLNQGIQQMICRFPVHVSLKDIDFRSLIWEIVLG